MADITIVNGVYKPTYNWGAPSCRSDGSMNAEKWSDIKPSMDIKPSTL
jgi:hypothetical protein